MKRQQWLMIAILFLSTLAALLGVMLSWDLPVLQIICGLILAWLAPGYALLLAINPRQSDRLERVVLSVPLSFVVSVLLGVALDQLPSGLSSEMLVAALAMVTLVLLGIGLLRQMALARELSATTEAEWTGAGDEPGAAGMPAVMLIGLLLSLALLLGAGWWAAGMLQAAAEITPKGFTSLAIERGATADQALQITIENREAQPMRYRLEVHAGGRLVKHSEGIALEPGARWSTPLTGTAAGERIEVLLFREGERQPYRQVHLQPD